MKYYLLNWGNAEQIIGWPLEFAHLSGDPLIRFTQDFFFHKKEVSVVFDYLKGHVRHAGKPLIPATDHFWLWHSNFLKLVRESLPPFKHRDYPARLLTKSHRVLTTEYRVIQISEIRDAAITKQNDRWVNLKNGMDFRDEVIRGTPVFNDRRIHPGLTFVTEEFVALTLANYGHRELENVRFINTLDVENLWAF